MANAAKEVRREVTQRSARVKATTVILLVSSTGQRNTLSSKQREGVLQMKQQKRRYYTEAEKAFMWDRWQIHTRAI